MDQAPVSRRSFVGGAAVTLATAWTGRTVAVETDGPPSHQVPSHQATGTRVGEMTADSAVVWTRLTERAERNGDGVVIDKRTDRPKGRLPVAVEELEGACPPAAGRVRLRYGTRADLADAVVTEWFVVTAAEDGIHQFRLSALTPATVYHYAVETTGPGGMPVHGAFRGQFQTAPRPDPEKPATEELDGAAAVRFCVMTCQGYPDRGHPDGHPIYPAMGALDPAFAVLTGDLVYYDNDPPRAVTPRLARYHWERMFSLPRLVAFTRSVGTYWLKDDHDTLDDDSWPGQTMGELSFAEGQANFRRQAPLTDGPGYRTVRWGRHLQLWFAEGRDHRSPNNQPDGPGKTIWGAEQKAWFKRTVGESDATWKVLVSPTPLVGPDRGSKRDNHANAGFRHEGDELRGWLRDHAGQGFFVICGDRHWQYHSVEPQTGLHEFCPGPASNEHAGGTPGRDPLRHRFHRVKGGFLSVEAAGEAIVFRHHDVNGQSVYEYAARHEPTA